MPNRLLPAIRDTAEKPRSSVNGCTVRQGARINTKLIRGVCERTRPVQAQGGQTGACRTFIDVDARAETVSFSPLLPPISRFCEFNCFAYVSNLRVCQSRARGQIHSLLAERLSDGVAFASISLKVNRL
jgi:hypothetical protein